MAGGGWVPEQPSSPGGVRVATETFPIANGGGTIDEAVTPANPPLAIVGWFLRNGADIIVGGSVYPLAGGLGRTMPLVPAGDFTYVRTQTGAAIGIINPTQVHVYSINGVAAGTWTLTLSYLY